MSALALSVVLSFVSAVAYAGGAIIQERVAVTSPGQTYAPLRRTGWWAAVALTGLGGLLHVVALAFGPLSLVQPLGALTIVFALPMAALFVGRRAGATAWRGAIMATVGLAGLLSLVGASDAQSLGNPQRLALGVVSGGAVAALMVAGRAAHRHPAVRSVLLAIAAGVAFSMSSVFTKTVAVDWSHHVSLADLSSLVAIGAFATAGMLISQASYRGAGLEAPLATLTVVNPVVAAAVGITMFGETFRYGTAGTALALACGVVAAGGLILLTTERIAAERSGSGDRTMAAGQEPAADLTTTAAREPAADRATTAVRVPATEEDRTAVRVPATDEGLAAAPIPATDESLTAVGVSTTDESLTAVRVPAADAGPTAVRVPAATAVSGLGPLAGTETTVAELLSGLPRPATGDADGLVPAAQPNALPQPPRTGGDSVFVPAPQPAVAGVFVAAAPAAAVAAAETLVARDPADGDELPHLAVMFGMPYVPMPFVNHHRTRVKS
ncbi:DMT family transporter [Streptomyces sp. NPDC127038]|uniref:DMT family transporter n=1 Tax=Streptomyces sp. NPDC127038 TaxID=3347114 RepID=UPI0036637F93